MMEYTEKDIPYGSYCYTITGIEKSPNGMPIIKIKICPFFHPGDEENVGCDFVKIYGDLLLSDQCKICGINEGDEDD